MLCIYHDSNNDELMKVNICFLILFAQALGREVLLHLIEYLVHGYGKNSTVTTMLDSMRIHIMPSMNPDGFEKAYSSDVGKTCTGIFGRYVMICAIMHKGVCKTQCDVFNNSFVIPIM